MSVKALGNNFKKKKTWLDIFILKNQSAVFESI